MAVPACARRLGARVTCSAMKFAFADTRSPCTEVTAVTARYLIQTLRKPNGLGVSAKHSKREKLLTPSSV